MPHLGTLRQDRESASIRALLTTPPLLLAAGGMWADLGIVPEFAWFVLELRTDRFRDEIKGDIDIIAGALDPADLAQAKLGSDALQAGAPRTPLDQALSTTFVGCALNSAAQQGRLRWPPPSTPLMAIEVKAAHYKEGAIRSRKGSRSKVARLREQMERASGLGFDKVGLLEVLTTSPRLRSRSNAWLAAAGEALDGIDKISPLLPDRLDSAAYFGHWVMALGAVGHRDETAAGAPAFRRIRVPRPIDATRIGELFRPWLIDQLSRLGPPRGLPIIVEDCRRCGALHYLGTCRVPLAGE